MRIIFSRDRPAQLDLLLRSINRYMRPEETRLLWYASLAEYERGYAELTSTSITTYHEFDGALRDALAASETVTFFCDDDVVYRPVPANPAHLLEDEAIFTVSLRLGKGSSQPLPPDFPVWVWRSLEPHDFGFPCSVDGHTFRSYDVERMLGTNPVCNPTMLETIMAHRASLFYKERELMTCFDDQCLVGVPVNRVSEESGVPNGERYPQSPQALNKRFLAGERIDLDAIDFSVVDSCHHEFKFIWS